MHIRDVARAIAFLKKEYGVKRWIGVGHSCGATMLCHYVAGVGLDEGRDVDGPEALVLLAGIYSFPLFLRNHSVPTVPENIEKIYSSIVTEAFGSDSSLYQSLSPTSGMYGSKTWRNGKSVVLAHSYEDELVERHQRDVMVVALDREGWSVVVEEGDEEALGRRVLEVRDIKGTHDFVWRDGQECAKLIGEVVERLST